MLQSYKWRTCCHQRKGTHTHTNTHYTYTHAHTHTQIRGHLYLASFCSSSFLLPPPQPRNPSTLVTAALVLPKSSCKQQFDIHVFVCFVCLCVCVCVCVCMCHRACVCMCVCVCSCKCTHLLHKGHDCGNLASKECVASG